MNTPPPEPLAQWWEPRRGGEATAEYLGRVLDELGAQVLAQQARMYHFDDFRCPPNVDGDANILRLVAALQDWSRSCTRAQRDQALAVVIAAKDGEFDGTKAEFDEWAASPDGQDTFRRLTDPDPEPAEDEGLWVRSEHMADGTYGVGLNVGADRSWPLNRDQATAYALACFAGATQVEHDTAVMRLFTAQLGIPAELAGQVIVKDLLPDRPGIDEATEPLRFVGIIGRARFPRPDAGQYIPLLGMELDGKPAGQLTPADLRGHATAVLDALTAADMDAALHRALTGTFGLEDPIARAAIHSLGQHWPTRHPPRSGPHD